MNAMAFQLADTAKDLELETGPVSNAMELSDQSTIFRADQTRRGYFGIGIENTKTPANLGTLWRSANLYNAAFLFTVGRRFVKQCSDTMKTERHIPIFDYDDIEIFYSNLPYGCQLVGVELTDDAVSLSRFRHPERAVYLLGAEDHGLTNAALNKCHAVVQIPTAKQFSMNVAVAGSLVMYDRFTKSNV